MADYFPMISCAVARLAKNTSENRQALYGRARVAPLEQLRAITLPLSNTQLIHEQTDLENAIREVEFDAGWSCRRRSLLGSLFGLNFSNHIHFFLFGAQTVRTPSLFARRGSEDDWSTSA